MTGEPAPYPQHQRCPTPRSSPAAAPSCRDAIIEIVTTVGLAVVLYLIITTFIVQTFRVEQTSMQNTLQSGEHLLIDKLTPRFDDYSRGDIIVFHPNGATDQTPYIKRVIGVGGDHVVIADGAGLHQRRGASTRPSTPTRRRARTSLPWPRTPAASGTCPRASSSCSVTTACARPTRATTRSGWSTSMTWSGAPGCASAHRYPGHRAGAGVPGARRNLSC